MNDGQLTVSSGTREVGDINDVMQLGERGTHFRETIQSKTGWRGSENLLSSDESQH